jgi:transcriptional regulator with XRE-family HTH domain
MSSNIYSWSSDLGQTLAELRKAADLTQTDIARSLNVDQSRVSRIEKGDVIPADTEINVYLSAIGTRDALAYSVFLKQDWQILECPSNWRHPQLDALYKAETYLQKIENFISKPDGSSFLMREADTYRQGLLREAEYLISLQHSISYVGDIGVGKTTAVCELTGLVIPQEAQIDRQSVLSTGGGGTTVCEVRIRQGLNFGIIVEPVPEQEIYKLVEDLCTNLNDSTAEEQENQQRGVFKEIERTLRNMTGLVRPKSRKGADGKIEKPIDPIIELAKECDNNQEALHWKVAERLHLWKRTRRDIWLEGTSQQQGLEWLKRTFADINYGRHKEFSLPQRIDVIVPNNVLHSSHYELEIIDTKGVEGTAIRPDIQARLDDERTLTMLCSRFNDAPNTSIQLLIEHLTKTRSKEVLEDRVILLILPRKGEASVMQDDTGNPVETDEEGYGEKQYQVQTRFQSIGGGSIPIYFLNVEKDDPKLISTALIERLEKLRKARLEQISNLITKIDYLFENQETELVLAAQRDVNKSLKIFVNQNRKLPSNMWPVHDYLLRAVQFAHAGTVWATTRRRGTWYNLNVYFLLGEGARADAQSRSQQAFNGLRELVKNKLDDQELQPVHKFLGAILDNLDLWHKSFLEAAQRAGVQTFAATLKESDIWAKSTAIWGSGGGYRQEVIDLIKRWFDDSQQKHLHHLLNTRIEMAWSEEVLEQLEKLTDDGIEAE